MSLPRVTPMPLARFDSPFEHPDWIFEPKLDGFRPVAYVEGGICRLVSRNRNAFKTFEPLAQAIAQELSGRSAILDGEIVRPGPDGRPMFYELMRLQWRGSGIEKADFEGRPVNRRVPASMIEQGKGSVDIGEVVPHTRSGPRKDDAQSC